MNPHLLEVPSQASSFSHTYIQPIQEPSISANGCFLWDILRCPCLMGDITTNDNALTIIYIILEVLKDIFFFLHKD